MKNRNKKNKQRLTWLDLVAQLTVVATTCVVCCSSNTQTTLFCQHLLLCDNGMEGAREKRGKDEGHQDHGSTLESNHFFSVADIVGCNTV